LQRPCRSPFSEKKRGEKGREGEGGGPPSYRFRPGSSEGGKPFEFVRHPGSRKGGKKKGGGKRSHAVQLRQIRNFLLSLEGKRKERRRGIGLQRLVALKAGKREGSSILYDSKTFGLGRKERKGEKGGKAMRTLPRGEKTGNFAFLFPHRQRSPIGKGGKEGKTNLAWALSAMRERGGKSRGTRFLRLQKQRRRERSERRMLSRLLMYRRKGGEGLGAD